MTGTADGLTISTTDVGDVSVFALDGDLDASTAPELARSLADALAAGRTKYVLDLSGVPFLDSSGIAAIVHHFKRVRIGAGDVMLSGVRPEVMKILLLIRLDRVFDIHSTAAEAVARFES